MKELTMRGYTTLELECSDESQESLLASSQGRIHQGREALLSVRGGIDRPLRSMHARHDLPDHKKKETS